MPRKREHLGWSQRLGLGIAVEKELCGKDKGKESLKGPFIQSIKNQMFQGDFYALLTVPGPEKFKKNSQVR